MQATTSGTLVAVGSLREFFRDAFHTASEHQHLDIDEQAEQYVVNLLTMFSLVDALNEVSDMSYRYTDADILRLYEIWMKTGSPRARGLLRELGVQPITVA